MTDLDGVAVIGLAGRFPQAPDLGQFWRNLMDGRDCLEEFGDDELRAQGVPEELLREPGYVRRARNPQADSTCLRRGRWNDGRP